MKPRKDRAHVIREWVAYAILIVVCSAILINRCGTVSNDTLGDTLAIGDRVGLMESYLNQDMDEAMVLVLTPTCPFCLQSLPFYKDIVEKRNASGHRLSIVAAVDTSISLRLQKQVLESSGVLVDTLVMVPVQDVPISLVPTVLHLDKRAVVISIWIGLLDEQQQKDVLIAVGLEREAR